MTKRLEQCGLEAVRSAQKRPAQLFVWEKDVCSSHWPTCCGHLASQGQVSLDPWSPRGAGTFQLCSLLELRVLAQRPKLRFVYRAV